MIKLAKKEKRRKTKSLLRNRRKKEKWMRTPTMLRKLPRLTRLGLTILTEDLRKIGRRKKRRRREIDGGHLGYLPALLLVYIRTIGLIVAKLLYKH